MTFLLYKKTFDKLKLLNLDSLVKLYNYYYNNTFLRPNAYTMEYIDNSHLSLLNQSKSYLLDIISTLEKDINILSNNNVIMYDAHYSNIIFQENKAKIIDIDLFRNNNFIDYKKLLYHNKEQLLKYVVSIIKHELQEQKTYNYLFDYIFCYSELLFTNVVDYLNEILTEDSIKDSIFKKKNNKN